MEASSRGYRSDDADLAGIAAKVMWWQEPEATLANRARFIAQLMRYGTWRELQRVKDSYGWEPFREVLRNAPPGLFDARSWNYWHGFFGLPLPEMPKRSLK